MTAEVSKPAIWVLTDGRAGNVAMALGLAERVAALCGGSVERRDVTLGRLGALAPPALWAKLPAKHVLRIASPPLAPPWPALVIGAGRRSAPFAAALRRQGAKAVQVLNPQMAPSRFDLIVTPEHDELQAPNAIATLGSVHRVTPQRLAEAKAQWAPHFAELHRPLLAVLIGGATKRTPLRDDSVDALAADLCALSADAGLVITASRRTGADQTARLRQAVPEAWFWDGEGENPYFGMLACADAILVTDDSVNMASEAASAGAPLAIYPLLEEGGKIARFHEALIARGHAERFTGHVPRASGPTLDETGRAAQAVAALLSAQPSAASSLRK